MDEQAVKALINELASNGTIRCEQAFEAAEKAGVSRAEIGRLLDEMEIKIVSCQLGCFG